MAPRRRRRLRGQRDLARPVLDALLPAGHDPVARLLVDPPPAAVLRDVDAGPPLWVGLRPGEGHRPALHAAARDRLAGPDRPVLHPHALGRHRHARRGLRHDRPGEGPDRRPDPPPPPAAERAPPSGHPDRDQPRLRGRGGDHRRVRVQLARARPAHRRGPELARLPGPPGDLPAPRGLGRAGEPRGGPRLQPARSAGPPVTAPTAGLELARPRVRRGRSAGFLRQVLARRTGLIGLLILVVFAVLAIVPDLLVGPLQTAVSATGGRLQAPTAAHLLGTDEVGRDMLNLTVHGTRI